MCMGRLGFDRGAGLSPSYLSPSLPYTRTCWASIWVCLPREESSTRSVSVLLHLTTRGGPFTKPGLNLPPSCALQLSP